MKRKFKPHTLPPWLRKTRNVCQPFVVPFCIFQAIRTLLIPTAFDILLLVVLILLTIGFYFDVI